VSARHLSTKLAAEFVGLAPKTLANMRSLGTGPDYLINVGGRITYDERDLERWRDSQIVERVTLRPRPHAAA
jgi:hypothetical protein